MKTITILSLILGLGIQVLAQDTTGMKYIPEGAYTPLYGAVDKEDVSVDGFYLDKYPVTNEQYLQFVTENPEWRKTEVIGLYAEESYLSLWQGDLEPGTKAPNRAPVVNVSWFAAKRYCEYHGKRLPTLDEWEYVVRADQTKADARQDTAYTATLLAWYEASKALVLPNVGRNEANFYGVYDMYGLVWEWVLDYNSVIITGESRQDKDSVDNSNLFCAGGAVSATDLMNYAAFMRYAFRGSLKGRYTTKTLGFRCASNVETVNP